MPARNLRRLPCMAQKEQRKYRKENSAYLQNQNPARMRKRTSQRRPEPPHSARQFPPHIRSCSARGLRARACRARLRRLHRRSVRSRRRSCRLPSLSRALPDRLRRDPSTDSQYAPQPIRLHIQSLSLCPAWPFYNRLSRIINCFLRDFRPLRIADRQHQKIR